MKTPSSSQTLRLLMLIAAIAIANTVAVSQENDADEVAAETTSPGLVVTYNDRSGAPIRRVETEISLFDLSESDNVAARDESSHAIVVTYTGYLDIQEPGDYQFSAPAGGDIELTVGDHSIELKPSQSHEGLVSHPVRFTFGRHPIRLVYRPIDTIQFRLLWSSNRFTWEPIAARWLHHDTEQGADDEISPGLPLLRAARCAACHAPRGEAPLSAPALDNLVGNIRRKWIVRRLETSTEVPPNGETFPERKMPHFALSSRQARAITAYLTQGQQGNDRQDPRPDVGDLANGERIFRTRGCVACHTIDGSPNDAPYDGGDLSQVGDKRPATYFARWLSDPASVNRDHRMPRFTLTSEEIRDLSGYLAGLASAPASEPAPGNWPEDLEQVQLGKKLVREFRCHACHRMPTGEADDVPAGTTGVVLPPGKLNWNAGCLNPPGTGESRPWYRLSASSQRALQRVVESPLGWRSESSAKSQLRHAIESSDYGRQLLAENNCLACHRRGLAPGIANRLASALKNHRELAAEMPRFEPPALDSVGDKLLPAALREAIAKPRVRRDWLDVRMPQYRLSDAQIGAMVEYLQRCDQTLNQTTAEPSESLRFAGRRLVTADGFGCTSCHQIGSQKPREVKPEAKGPLLSMLGERIRRQWFERWLHDPARIVPRMEMPSVRVPVPGVLDSDLDQQVAAVWAILNQPNFEPPAPDAIRVLRQTNKPDNRDPAKVLTDNLEVDGRLFVKPFYVALANRHNVLFDQQTYRLAGWRIGDAARQRTRQKYWYWEASGAPIFAIDDRKAMRAELRFVYHGDTFEPRMDPHMPPAFDDWGQSDGGVTFATRLIFASPNPAAPIFNVRMEQRFRALVGDKPGFERIVRIAGIPAGALLQYDLLPGETMVIENDPLSISDGDRDLAKSKHGLAEVGFHSLDDTQFDAGDQAQLTIACNGKVVGFNAFYQAHLPADRFLTPAFPPIFAKQESLDVLPGFNATRLSLPTEIMPTGFAWQHGDTMFVASLKGRIWRVDDNDHDGLEEAADDLGVELVAPYGIATAIDAKGHRVLDVVDKTSLMRLHFDASGRSVGRVETLVDGWGHSSDYHGWAVGLPRDEEGNYYIAVSQRKGPDQLLIGRAIQLKSRQPTPDNARPFELNPLTRGSRFPLGIARRQLDGAIFITDNQGQYTVYNELNHVVPGAHFGHPSGLPREEFEKHAKTGPSVAIPHPWTRSVNGICFLETPPAVREQIGRSLFGPWEGHLVGCEYDTGRLVRISLQKVGDRFQGAVYPLSAPATNRKPALLGPIAAAIAPDGDLYIGSIRDSAWGAGQNVGEIVRAKFNGNLPPGIAEVQTLDNGFEISFTSPVDSAKLAAVANYSLLSYRREATPAYGGPDLDRRSEKIDAVEPADDAQSVVLRLPEMRRGHLYEIHLQSLVDGEETFFPAEAYVTVGPIPQ
ncbi:MAG: c-type cytochrome [Planctomycetales bacterium]|nr:c-type cytochrome [Planctomycetales bacterium]